MKKKNSIPEGWILPNIEEQNRKIEEKKTLL